MNGYECKEKEDQFQIEDAELIHNDTRIENVDKIKCLGTSLSENWTKLKVA